MIEPLKSPKIIAEPGRFNYCLRRQSSCPGLYAHVIGQLESCHESFIFENRVLHGEIPPEFIPACEQGFREAISSGPLAGYPVTGVKVILEGGSYDDCASSPLAFKIAARQGFYQGFLTANPVILEPIMTVVVQTCDRFVEAIIQDFLSHRGLIQGVDKNCVDAFVDAFVDATVIRAEVPLSELLGYASRWRSLSEGHGNFSMQFKDYQPVPHGIQQQLIAKAVAG
jgi:elongation factor G